MLFFLDFAFEGRLKNIQKNIQITSLFLIT